MSTTGQGGTPGTAGAGSPDPSRRPPASTPPAPSGVRPTGTAAPTGTTTATRPVPQQGTRSGNPAAPGATRAPQKRAAARPGAQRPASAAPRRTSARRVKLAVARVDPWSVMKMSFLLSVAVGVAGVILTAVLWLILSGMGVFSDVDRLIKEVASATTDPFNLMDYIGFGRVISLSIVVGVIDIILMTAIATLGAFLYNICSSLVGGVQLTLTDD